MGWYERPDGTRRRTPAVPGASADYGDYPCFGQRPPQAGPAGQLRRTGPGAPARLESPIHLPLRELASYSPHVYSRASPTPFHGFACVAATRNLLIFDVFPAPWPHPPALSRPPRTPQVPYLLVYMGFKRSRRGTPVPTAHATAPPKGAWAEVDHASPGKWWCGAGGAFWGAPGVWGHRERGRGVGSGSGGHVKDRQVMGESNVGAIVEGQEQGGRLWRNGCELSRKLCRGRASPL